jgi:HAD superfamily hydrolase (TIGR01459 family)
MTIQPAFPAVPIQPGLSGLVDRYDGYIIDLWGVLHDGAKAYPGAVDCLRRLRERGKRIVILSNAPRRAEAVARRTAEIGITPDLYDHLLSSGEEAWQSLQARQDPWYAELGRRLCHLGPARDRGMLDGLDVDEVPDAAAADFILATGLDGPEDSVAAYEPALAAGAARGIPLICANPDLEVVRDGVRELCAGALAARYEELGGEVRYHGKPYPSVYRSCLDLLGITDRARILGVGDSLRTDIAGAAGAGIDSLLVIGGIHAEELAIPPGAPLDPQRLAALSARLGHQPTASVPAFTW